MNNKEIRLEILLDYYVAERSQTRYTEQNNERLREIDAQRYNFNFGYLIKRKLIEGSVHYGTRGIPKYAATGGITANRIDVVEHFVDECVSKSKRSVRTTLTNLGSYIEKILELFTIWS